MINVTDLPKLASRNAYSHKGTFGKALIVAGSRGMAGAAAIAAKAALRSGAGLVKAATPKSVLTTVASFDPCYTTLPLPEDHTGKISFSESFRLFNHGAMRLPILKSSKLFEKQSYKNSRSFRAD